MHSEFMELGSLLRERRESMGLSLQEVELATSIRISYIESIERGHLGKLISPVYAHGFIKQYAIFLDLDPLDIFSRYPSLAKVLSDKKGEFSDFNLEVSSIEMRGAPKRILFSSSLLLWVSIGSVVMISLWLIMRRYALL